jgi:hypothetical protein
LFPCRKTSKGNESNHGKSEKSLSSVKVKTDAESVKKLKQLFSTLFQTRSQARGRKSEVEKQVSSLTN